MKLGHLAAFITLQAACLALAWYCSIKPGLASHQVLHGLRGALLAHDCAGIERELSVGEDTWTPYLEDRVLMLVVHLEAGAKGCPNADRISGLANRVFETQLERHRELYRGRAARMRRQQTMQCEQ